VEADVGPAFQTQRQETWNAFVEILSSAPELMNVFGDLGFLAADFPMADEIAERIRRNIEQTAPWLVKDGQVGPVVQKLQADLANSQQQVAELLEKLADARLKMKGRAELRDIEVEDAMTRRLTAEGNVVTDFAKLGDSIPELKLLIRQTMADMLGMGLRDVEAAVQPELSGGSSG
jgi:septation ring formation regulator EzrA